MGTTTNVADFLDAVFFPFISATIEFDPPFQLLFEIGTTNSVTISGSTTANDETIFSLGRIDKIYTGVPTQIYAFGAATTYTTSVTFSPTQVVSTQDAWYRTYQTVANGVGPATEIQSNVKYIQSCYPYLHGVSSIDLTSGGTAAYTVLTHLIEQKGNKTTYPLGTNGYLYFCYPASYGSLTSILDPNLFPSLASFTQFTANVTSVGLINNWTESYYIYQYNNLSTFTGLSFQFIY